MAVAKMKHNNECERTNKDIKKQKTSIWRKRRTIDEITLFNVLKALAGKI